MSRPVNASEVLVKGFRIFPPYTLLWSISAQYGFYLLAYLLCREKRSIMIKETSGTLPASSIIINYNRVINLRLLSDMYFSRASGSEKSRARWEASGSRSESPWAVCGTNYLLPPPESFYSNRERATSTRMEGSVSNRSGVELSGFVPTLIKRRPEFW